MKIRQTTLITILLIAFTLSGYCQNDEVEYKFNGFADSYHALRAESPNDFMSSRSRLRTELRITKDKSYLFTSLNAIHNSILEDQTQLELREAYFQYTTTNWDLKLGRQIITWGVADAMRITDIISPMDYTEFLARDYDDIRIPVNGFKIKYLKTDYNFEFVFIPVSEYFVMPIDPDNPWSMINSTKFVVNNQKPDKKLKNCEIGGRFSFFLRGIDFSVSALHTWNKAPVYRSYKLQGNDTIFMEANYDQLDMIGFDLSASVGDFVIRGEAAAYFSEIQKNKMAKAKPVSSDNINAILGIDWYPGNDWTINAQYSHKLITNHKDEMATDKNTSFSTFGITKKLLRNTLTLSTFAHIDITNEGFFNRFSADYSLTDQIHMLMGYDHFEGDKGMFGVYNKNSEIWVKVKFSF